MALSTYEGTMVQKAMNIIFDKENLVSAYFPTSKINRMIRIKDDVDIFGESFKYRIQISDQGNASPAFLTGNSRALNTRTERMEFTASLKRLFSPFNVLDEEIKRTDTPEKAAASVVLTEYKGALQNMRAIVTLSIFGTGFGELFQAKSSVTADTNGIFTITIPRHATHYFYKNKVFEATVPSAGAASLPNDPLDTDLFTVLKKDGRQITMQARKSDGAIDAAKVIPLGTWFCFLNCRTVNGTQQVPLLPEGLPALIPHYADRRGTNWTTSDLLTNFRGQDRSDDVEASCGYFVLQGDTDPTSDNLAGDQELMGEAMIRALNLVCDSGYEDGNKVLINTHAWRALEMEEKSMKTFMQTVNSGQGKTDNDFTTGVANRQYLFQSASLKNVYADGWVPVNLSYIVGDKDENAALTWCTIDSRAKTVIADGKPEETFAGERTIQEGGDNGMTGIAKGPIQLDIDNYITLRVGDTDIGPGTTVTLKQRGAWIIQRPQDWAVIRWNNDYINNLM